MSKNILNHVNRATRAQDLFTVRRQRRVAFKRAVAKVKPSRTRRPRQLAQLLPVLEAALFMQELASEATSNLGLHGSVGGRPHVLTLRVFLLSPASQLEAGARAVHWKHMDECTFSWVKEDSNVLTVLTGSDCVSAGQPSTTSRPEMT